MWIREKLENLKSDTVRLLEKILEALADFVDLD